MSLLYTILKKLSRVVQNQKRHNDNLKLVAAIVSTPKDPLVLEFANDSTFDYPPTNFEDITDKDGPAQGEGDDDGDEESMGDQGGG